MINIKNLFIKPNDKNINQSEIKNLNNNKEISKLKSKAINKTESETNPKK